jgi:tetratricopeptide (TPR) repeat protein
MRRLLWIVLAGVLLLGSAVGWYFARPLSAEKLVNRGTQKLQRGDLDGAIADLTRALERDPAAGQAHYQRALAYCGKADWEAACADLNQVIERSGGTQGAPARTWRALARMHRGDLAGSLDDCEEALQHAPRFPMAYVRRGQAKSARGDSAAAIDDFDKAIELDPRCTDAWTNRGYERLKLGLIPEGQSDLAEAKRLQDGRP